MCQLSRCCCCIELRTGAIIIAVLGILGSFGGFGNGWIAGVCVLILGLVANCCLLHGAIKYNKVTTTIYLVLEMISIILIVAAAVFAIVVIAGATAVGTAASSWDAGNVASTAVLVVGIVSLVAYIIGIALQIYWWVCVFSFLKELKRTDLPFPA